MKKRKLSIKYWTLIVLKVRNKAELLYMTTIVLTDMVADLSVSILQFKLPLDYDKPDGETITVSGMLVKKTTDKSEEPGM